MIFHEALLSVKKEMEKKPDCWFAIYCYNRNSEFSSYDYSWNQFEREEEIKNEKENYLLWAGTADSLSREAAACGMNKTKYLATMTCEKYRRFLERNKEDA